MRGDQVYHPFAALDLSVDLDQSGGLDDLAKRLEHFGSDDQIGGPRRVLDRNKAHAFGVGLAPALPVAPVDPAV